MGAYSIDGGLETTRITAPKRPTPATKTRGKDRQDRRAPHRRVPTEWQAKAACRNTDPELYFPIGTTGPALQQIELAKAVCGGCRVIDECLSWALDHQQFGVAGGMTEDERREIKARARQAVST